MRRLRRNRNEEIIEGEIIEEVPSEATSRGFFRRRQRPQADSSYERVAPDIPTPEEVQITEYTRRRSRDDGGVASRIRLPRFNLSRLLVWREVRPGLLVLALGLVAGGIFWTLSNLNRVPQAYEEWWAAVLLAFALVWSLIALAMRQAAAFLAGAGLAGISLSLLLDAQGVATWRETLVGVVLITLGLGIIARALLLRQGTVAH